MRVRLGGGSRLLHGGISVGRGGVRAGIGVGPIGISGGSRRRRSSGRGGGGGGGGGPSGSDDVEPSYVAEFVILVVMLGGLAIASLFAWWAAGWATSSGVVIASVWAMRTRRRQLHVGLGLLGITGFVVWVLLLVDRLGDLSRIAASVCTADADWEVCDAASREHDLTRGLATFGLWGTGVLLAGVLTAVLWPTRAAPTRSTAQPTATADRTTTKVPPRDVWISAAAVVGCVAAMMGVVIGHLDRPTSTITTVIADDLAESTDRETAMADHVRVSICPYAALDAFTSLEGDVNVRIALDNPFDDDLGLATLTVNLINEYDTVVATKDSPLMTTIGGHTSAVVDVPFTHNDLASAGKGEVVRCEVAVSSLLWMP